VSVAFRYKHMVYQERQSQATAAVCGFRYAMGLIY